MKKSGPDRKYTDEFREAAVKQVVDGGRAIRQVARSLEMSAGTLGNWVARANKGEALSKLPAGKGSRENKLIKFSFVEAGVCSSSRHENWPT